MKKAQNRKLFCVVLLSINLVFIWGNSLLPGHLSGAFSQWLGKLLERLLSLKTLETDQGHGLLRKIAHFTEFSSLGLLLCWLVVLIKKKWWLACLFGVLAACVDESIQMIVPGRGPAIRDVAIDAAGVLLGVAVFRLLRLVWKNQRD